jgi:hypothetical protein
MIFRLTQSLNARVKAGKLEALPLRENPLLDWSAHLFSVDRGPFILLSNTASLLSAVVSAHGITSQARFRLFALDSIRQCVESHGVGSVSRTIVPADGDTVQFAKALNRSVSGSMNELVRLAELLLAEGELTLPAVGDRLNDTLLSALATGESHGYGKPREAFRALASEGGSNAERSQAGDRRQGLEQRRTD